MRFISSLSIAASFAICTSAFAQTGGLYGMD